MTSSPGTSDRRVCRRLLREGSKSFFGASVLLPRRVRDDAGAVYAWCRLADHAVDRTEVPAGAMANLSASLERVYGGTPSGPVERAFAETAARHRVPRSIPEAMLEGFEWDLAGRTYETLEDLCGYCVRVGSTVGVMMTLVMGVRRKDLLTAACRLGVAMQLTNIARDVGDDARAGRLYLPVDWLRESELIPAAWLEAPDASHAIRTSVGRLLDCADGLYADSWTAIAELPARCRPGIRAAAVAYAEIARKIRAVGCDSVNARVWTGKREKAVLLARATVGLPGAWARARGTDRKQSGEGTEAFTATVDGTAACLVHAVAG